MTATRHEQLIELLWNSMKRDPEHKDRVRTGWGTKTQIGLVASIERIFENQTKALGAIQQVMDGKQWSPDTLEDIAKVLEQAGFEVRPPA